MANNNNNSNRPDYAANHRWSEATWRAGEENRDQQNTGSRGYEGVPYGNAGNYGFGADMYDNDRGRRDYGRSNLGHHYGSGGTSYQNRNSGGTSTGGDGPYFNSSSRRYENFAGNRGGQNNDRSWWQRTRDKIAERLGNNDAAGRQGANEQQGEHRGKGPKGYKRSEESLREDIYTRLSDDERVDATGVSVELQGDEVILSGQVNSLAEKRRAADLVESITGVRHVENHIRVAQSGAGNWDNAGR
jgi:hypothetical protein